MIGLDTNVIVRYLAQDDNVQTLVATKLIERLTPENPGYVSSVVLAEITWVLSRAYKTPRGEIANAIENILRSAELVTENAEAAYRALGRYRAGIAVDYADALIAETATLAGAQETVTFDKHAAAEAGMRLLR